MNIQNIAFPVINSWKGKAAFSFATLCVCIVIAEGTERYLPGDESLLILFSGTILVSLIAGFLAGSAIAILSVLGQNYLFQTPHSTFSMSSSSQMFELTIFLIAASFLGWVGSQLHRAYTLAHDSKAEAERASKSREDLIAVVSHDLRNPLSAIKLNANLLERMPDINKNSHASKIIKTIVRSTDRASRLIQDLLDFEKIRAGQLSIELHPTTSMHILNELNEMMAPIATKNLLELSVREPISTISMTCDKDRLIQALSNLVGNAIKFTSEGGKIEIGCIGEHENVQFFVRDTGPGISPEHQLHLFDRYWQASNTTRQGAGLGLAITKGIVEAHRGKIWVESRLGEGSTFWFEIPKQTEGFGLRLDQKSQIYRPSA
jgi:signal transduction histidine kinase